MRIAIITPGFSTDEADWAIPVLQHLLRHLSQIHDIELISLRYPHRKAEYPFYRAKVHSLGGAYVGGVQRFPLFQSAFQVIFNAHKRNKFDLIHGFWADEAGFLAVLAGALLRRPTVVTVMGGELVQFPHLGYGGQRSRINRILTRVAIQQAKLVTIGSESLRKYVIQRPVTKLTEKLPLGVDTAIFKPGSTRRSQVGMKNDGSHLLCVASLVPIKNHALLFKALRSLIDRIKPVYLHLIGEGYLRPHLENLSKKIGIQDFVTFHGKVPHLNLVDYYNAADLLLVSSLYESQSMVVLEAGACGLPTVGTAVGILPELENAARTVPAQDALAFAQAIMDMIQNTPRKAEMAKVVLEQVHTRYTIQNTVESFSALYEEVCHQK
jgi:glycosyltransferase involved in cell wall biosynthesis